MRLLVHLNYDRRLATYNRLTPLIELALNVSISGVNVYNTICIDDLLNTDDPVILKFRAIANPYIPRDEYNLATNSYPKISIIVLLFCEVLTAKRAGWP